MILSIIRRLLFIPSPLIDAKRALSIATEECISHGCPIGNCRIIEGLKTWTIWANDNKGSPFVVVDQQTGSVIKYASILR